MSVEMHKDDRCNRELGLKEEGRGGGGRKRQEVGGRRIKRVEG